MPVNMAKYMPADVINLTDFEKGNFPGLSGGVHPIASRSPYGKPYWLQTTK